MANLIEYIQSQVYENSTEDISGSIMQQVLTRMASDEGVVNVHTISGQTPFADYNNAQAARDAVPAGFKKLGLIITYKLSSGWYIDEFIGSATSGWSTASNWKCLGPISVSQNAETGKTTITIGSQSYDVATQPVSVSQNTLSIGGEVKGELAGQLVENLEWIKVVTDSEGKILYGVKTDGNFYFGAGCPNQVREYVSKKITELTPLFNNKVDKVIGKSLIDEVFASANNSVESSEWMEVTMDADGHIVEGRKIDGTKVIYKYKEMEDVKSTIRVVEDILEISNESGDFYVGMTDSQFVSTYNAKLVEFCTLCKCQVYGMQKLYVADSIEVRCKKINHNFRADAVSPDMNTNMFISQLNRYFKKRIFRFVDAKLNPTNNVNASLRVGSGGVQYEGIGEPSALISDDGQKIELFTSQGIYTETTDGVNWAVGQSYIYHDNTWDSIEGHRSVNKVDGKYMMIAHTHYGGDDYFDLLLSEDKINFYYKGHLFKNGSDIGDGRTTTHLGNTYLFKDGNGTYYLIYEARIPDAGFSYELCLMSCTDILASQADDFIGNWVQCPTNPIIASPDYPCCNPEIIKGQDNQPLKYNGRFYMYYLSYLHYGNEWVRDRVATIRRAYSEDLIHWTDEGIVFDNRDTPDGGEGNADNGDQCFCQFKGRSYFFYSHNVNNYGEGTYPVPMSIRYTIDDRPLLEILKLKP